MVIINIQRTYFGQDHNNFKLSVYVFVSAWGLWTWIVSIGSFNYWYHGNTCLWDCISADQMLLQMRTCRSRNIAEDTNISLFAQHGKHCCDTKNVSDKYYFLQGHGCVYNNASATCCTVEKPSLNWCCRCCCCCSFYYYYYYCCCCCYYYYYYYYYHYHHYHYLARISWAVGVYGRILTEDRTQWGL